MAGQLDARLEILPGYIRLFSLRAARTTFAPALLSPFTNATPSPDNAPVIIATLSVMLNTLLTNEFVSS